MTKRARQTSANSRKKVKIPKDFVNGLPDDILISMISRLPVREAARTSILSRRWKYFWTFITNLDFEPPKSALATSKSVVQQNQERYKYINWVNRVLELHRSTSVNEFRIRFDLVGCHGSSITKWIYTAMSKSVQKFELNLERAWYRKLFCEQYTFPKECYNNLKNPGGLYGIKSLRSLCFSDVNVTGEILEFFIHNCPLDRLHVAGSCNLRILKVVGSSIQLKYLDICHCIIKAVEISAPSLLSFKYYGSKIKLNIENVPQLVDFSIHWYSFSRLDLRRVTDLLVSYFPQLTNLELGYHLVEIYKELSDCALPNLRHLTLGVQLRNREGLLFLTYVIKACPFLQKLTLMLAHVFLPAEREIHPIPEYPLRHLKVLELFEYHGKEIELDIVSYLLKDATMLEKVVVKAATFNAKRISEECPKVLGPKLPQRVQLIVLKSYRAKHFTR